MRDHIIASTDEVENGQRIIAQVQGREVAVFKIEDEYYAYTNWCAHQGGPCCEGSLTGTWQASFDRNSLEINLDWKKDDEILNCPWHGWEYDVKTGDCLSKNKVRLPKHKVTVEDNNIVVSLPG